MEKEKENKMIKSLCRRHILMVCKENSVFKKIYHNEDQSKELIEIEIVYLLSKINLTPQLLKYTNAHLANTFSSILEKRTKKAHV